MPMRPKQSLPRRILMAVPVFLLAGIALYAYLRPEPAAPEESPAAVMESAVEESGSEAPVDAAADTAIAIAAIPFSDPDWPAPFRGAEQWHYASVAETIAHPTESNPAAPLDVYKRTGLRWDELEKGEGEYTFKPIDDLFQSAIRKRQRVGFGIMTQYPDQPDGQKINGAAIAYPLYLHEQMQAAPEQERDYVSPENASFWVPNYNSPIYLGRFEALLRAIADHIARSSYQGVAYRDAFGYADIRGFGSWGEWHMVGAVSSPASYPAGRRPTVASLKRIIDAHLKSFSDVPLVAIISAFDADRLQNTLVPAEIGHYLLTSSNKWGRIGWRRDNWGWTDNYLSFWMDKNEGKFAGMRFDTAIMNRWKYAPVLGEPACGGTAKGGPCPFYDLPRQVRFYHASMIGNGNFCGDQRDAAGRDSMRMAWKWSGYRLGIKQLVLPKKSAEAGSLQFRVDWTNTGVAPLYEHWEIWYALEDAQSGKLAWEGKSTFTLRLKLPGAKAYSAPEKFRLPQTVKSGNYRLVVSLRDPSGYRKPLPLAIPGRRADGAYVLLPALEFRGS